MQNIFARAWVSADCCLYLLMNAEQLQDRLEHQNSYDMDRCCLKIEIVKQWVFRKLALKFVQNWKEMKPDKILPKIIRAHWRKLSATFSLVTADVSKKIKPKSIEEKWRCSWGWHFSEEYIIFTIFLGELTGFEKWNLTLVFKIFLISAKNDHDVRIC